MEVVRSKTKVQTDLHLIHHPVAKTDIILITVIKLRPAQPTSGCICDMTGTIFLDQPLHLQLSATAACNPQLH